MKRVVKNLFLCAAILVTWQIASMFTLPLFIPSPISVLSALWTMIENGTLLQAALYSLKRITLGVAIASVVSLGMAVLMQASSIAKSFLYPVVKLLRYLPSTAFYPLLICWFGIEEKMKVIFLFFVSFVYMMPSVVMAFEDTPRDMYEAGKALGLSHRQILTRIVFPYCLPSVLKSFALMYGIGWTFIVCAEETNAIYGLGYMINNASSRGRTEVVFAAIVVIILISIVFDYATDKAINKIFKWRD